MKKILLHSAITFGFIVLDTLLIHFVSDTLSGFYIFASLLFNPFYGAVACAVLPIISYVINPGGGIVILSLMVIIAFAKGLLIGALRKLFHNKKDLIFQIIAGVSGLLLLTCAIILGIEIRDAIAILIFTLIFLISDIIICRISNAELSNSFIKIYLCIGIAEVFSEMLNTIAYYDHFNFLHPIISTLSIAVFISYSVTVLINIFHKIRIQKNPV